MTTAEHVRVGVRHPLEPLTAGEIETVGRILKRDRGLAASARFVYVTLREPAKDAVLRYQPGEAFEREAHVVLRERAEYKTYEAVVSLTAGEVRLWRELPGVQPAIMLEEFVATEEAVRKDARWQKAMRRRGITDFDMVMIDPWSVGYNGPEDAAVQGRFLRPLTWVRRGDPDDNGYARPQDSVLPFCQPDTPAMRRAQFATRHLWVTEYDPGQRFPAGDYPNQHPGGDGLPAWTAADRPLENTDLVLWHTFTAHHVVRPEDWPVMPVTRVGFQLRADGFFDGNPALDVPPAEQCHHQG